MELFGNLKVDDDLEYGLDEIDLAADCCRDDFYFFVQEFWSTIIEDKPVWNWHMEFICDELQLIAERIIENKPKEYDLVINVPPGTSKSTIVSVMFPIWIWLRKQSARSICASYTQTLSLNLSRLSRLVLNSDRFKTYFPEIALADDQNAKGYFINSKGGFRVATSTGSTIIGFHGHLLIADDLIDPMAAVSAADIKTVGDWMVGGLMQRKVDKEVSTFVMVMQRLSQDDPTGQLLKMAKEKGLRIRHICLPAEDSELVSPPEAKKFYKQNEGLLDPIRLPRTVLKEQEAVLGAGGYSGQYRQSPIPPGGRMFDVSKLKVVAPPLTGFTKIVRYWDKAGSDDEGCYTVGLKMGVHGTGPERRFWILGMERFRKSSNEREAIIKQTAQNDGVHVYVVVEQEPGSSGKDMASYTITNLAGYKIRAERPTGDKIHRADVFSVQVNEGNVYLAPGDYIAELVEELKYFPNSKYKDITDAGSGAFRECLRRLMIGAL